MNQANRAEVGVLVGRFQVHKLHEGHKELINAVLSLHKKVIIFLGSTPGVLVTRQNPLDFLTRKLMLQEYYPQVTILPLSDSPSDDAWSRTLDSDIQKTVGDHLSVTLYGSRDSFAPHYKGRFPVVEMEESFKLSGTAVRKEASMEVRCSPDFRQGIIYAAFNRHPISYQAVDAILLDINKMRVVVGRKSNDIPGFWRFPGGFVSPEKDKSLEHAASRELQEEIEGAAPHIPGRYIGSFLTNDWRYRREDDKIMSAIFVFDYAFGDPKAKDDLELAAWEKVDNLRSVIIPGHQPIVEALYLYLQREKKNEKPQPTAAD